MKKTIALLVGIVLLCGASQEAVAKKIVVNLTSSNLTTRTDASASMGNYYVLTVPVPEEIKDKELYGAYMELYVDASTTEDVSGHDPAPRLQVYALKSVLGESFDDTKIEAGPGITSVPIGSSKRVKVDVTDVIRGWIETPSSNNGVVVGALTGAQDGRFTLRSDALGSGAVARLVVHYES